MFMPKDEKEIVGKKCEKCGSSQTYLRLSIGQRVCRNCGYISKAEIEVKNGRNKS